MESSKMSDNYDKVKSQQLYDLTKKNEAVQGDSEDLADEEAALALIADPTVDVNFSYDGDNGKTPLWQAACNGHEKVVKIFLEHPY